MLEHAPAGGTRRPRIGASTGADKAPNLETVRLLYLVLSPPSLDYDHENTYIVGRGKFSQEMYGMRV